MNVLMLYKNIKKTLLICGLLLIVFSAFDAVCMDQHFFADKTDSEEPLRKKIKIASDEHTASGIDPAILAFGDAVFRGVVRECFESFLAGTNLGRASSQICFLANEMSELFFLHINDPDDQGRTLLSIAREKGYAARGYRNMVDILEKGALTPTYPWRKNT